MKKKVLIAMSGGVDSSLAAYCLLEKGYDVRGIFMRFSSSNGPGGLEKTRAVTARLKMPLAILDVRDDFKNQVIEYFHREYVTGRTPNPCVVCNQKMKFKYLLAKAEELNADYISTGHYAKVEYDSDQKRFVLKQGIDRAKDQSYMLFSLDRRWLGRIIFPLGSYVKDKIRDLARELKLENYNSPDSQDVCFANGDYRNFLKNTYGEKFSFGPIVNEQGSVLGRHNGISHFTIGQRKGLGIASGKPLYVTRLDSERNTVMVGDRKEVSRDELTADSLNWLMPAGPPFPFRAQVKIRYKHPKSWATVSKLTKDRLKVKFDLAQLAVTPGQAVVFYDQETVLGGGWIE
ncbi:MAG: tRNA 2-thiouridine(34) synthase MnmA [Candidatus Omnitrophota bacterium]|nr:tRNA 2-thiouridine(34) synthase MnmA [Candidatus Omnitrophota bacterium]